jgi:hypothetical protein
VRLYNDTIMSFLGHATRVAQEILTKECHLKFSRTRFHINNITYPLSLICFEGDSRWGYFESEFYTIGLNSKLIGRVDDITLKNLLRHEIAHYLVFIESGSVKPHGEEFKEMCQRFRWPQEVALPSGDLLRGQDGDLKADAVIEKVKKLLNLASSSNPFEAELATIKANQLILKHHLSRSDLAGETIYIKTLLSAPKRTALMMSIYEILSHFLVRPLLHMGRGRALLEAGGTREQVELASYISDYLVEEFEALWKTHAQKHGLKGLREKNSFYTGIARGFSEKLTHSRAKMDVSDTRALVKIEQDLKLKVDTFLGGLSRAQSSQTINHHALERGKAAGRELNIRQGVKNAGPTRLLGL